jgi:DNA-directed RNA polymerase sigma subunit (sigma70/sigma32)
LDDLEVNVRGDYLDSMLDQLNDVDRKLVIGKFALEGGEPETLQAMGNRFGISRERARQRLNRAITKLQYYSTKCSSI